MDPSTLRPHIVYPGSDIILRTKDGVELHVHKQVLRETSQTFRSMLSIPAVNNELPPQPIDIEEDVTTFLPVLQYIYGHELSVQRFDSHHDVLPILEAARKYEVGVAEAALLSHLGKQLDKEPNPLRAWAIAIRYKLEDARVNAAQRYYEAWDDQRNELDKMAELQFVNGKQLAELLATRRYVTREITICTANYLFPSAECGGCAAIEEVGEVVDHVDSNGVTVYAKTTREVWEGLVKDRPLYGWADHPAVIRWCIETSSCDECKGKLPYMNHTRKYYPDHLLSHARREVRELRRTRSASTTHLHKFYISSYLPLAPDQSPPLSRYQLQMSLAHQYFSQFRRVYLLVIVIDRFSQASCSKLYKLRS